MPFSTYLANKLLDHADGKTAFTQPTLYVALATNTPSLDGTTTVAAEPTGGGYARVQVAGANWNAATGGSVSNTGAITFPTASADWSAQANFVTGVLFDAASGGNMLGYGTLTVQKNCLSGDTMIISAGQLQITLS